jgi:hypothetical protein
MSASSTKSTGKWREVAMNPNHFAGKTAVVTGAAQGIGCDVALRLAREGARVPRRDGGAAAPRPPKHRSAERTGEGLVPADRGSSSLLQPDEALRNNGRADGGNSVPGLGRGLLHHRRPLCPWQAATSAEPLRSDRFRLVIRIEGGRDERRAGHS